MNHRCIFFYISSLKFKKKTKAGCLHSEYLQRIYPTSLSWCFMLISCFSALIRQFQANSKRAKNSAKQNGLSKNTSTKMMFRRSIIPIITATISEVTDTKLSIQNREFRGLNFSHLFLFPTALVFSSSLVPLPLFNFFLFH